MLATFRRAFIDRLQQAYCKTLPEMQLIETLLFPDKAILDHFAVIDLPGPHTGIPPLSKLLTTLGFEKRGSGYLPDKQNDFLWLAEEKSDEMLADNALPQIVIADFRLDELPASIRNIIYHHAKYAAPLAINDISTHLSDIRNGHVSAHTKLMDYLVHYFSGRDWPLPDKYSFEMVWEFNRLLAWVLIFGRRPNHFTIAVHLLKRYSSLANFHCVIEQHSAFQLNQEGGVIKGSKTIGLEQSSTTGISQRLLLNDGEIFLPLGFIEFVWRYPHTHVVTPALWSDFYTGFIAEQANYVIESLR